MKDLLYCLNSVEETYGEVALNTIIQINERIIDIDVAVKDQQPLNELLRDEYSARIEKLVELNRKIQEELRKQEDQLTRSITPLITKAYAAD